MQALHPYKNIPDSQLPQFRLPTPNSETKVMINLNDSNDENNLHEKVTSLLQQLGDDPDAQEK